MRTSFKDFVPIIKSERWKGISYIIKVITSDKCETGIFYVFALKLSILDPLSGFFPNGKLTVVTPLAEVAVVIGSCEAILHHGIPWHIYNGSVDFSGG